MDPSNFLEPDSLLELAKNFQQAWSALLGFTGVIITLLVNARNARKLEVFKINQKRRSVEAAILAELEYLCECMSMLLERARIVQNGKDQGYSFIVTTEIFGGEFFEKIRPDIGVLDRECAKSVLEAVLKISETPRMFQIFMPLTRRSDDNKTLYIDYREMAQLAQILEERLSVGAKAIHKVTSKANGIK